MSFDFYSEDDYYSEEGEEGWPWATPPQSTPIPPELRKLQVTTLLVVCSVGVLIVMALCACMFYKNERILSRMPWRRRRDGPGRRGSKRRRGLFGLPAPFSTQRGPSLTTMMGQGILMPGLYTVASQRQRPSVVAAFSPQAEAANATETSVTPRRPSQAGGLLLSPDTLQGVLSTGTSPTPSLRNTLSPEPEVLESDGSSIVSSTMVTPETPSKEPNMDGPHGVNECTTAAMDMKEKEIDSKYSRKSLKRNKRRSTTSSSPDPEVGTLNTEMTCLGGRI